MPRDLASFKSCASQGTPGLAYTTSTPSSTPDSSPSRKSTPGGILEIASRSSRAGLRSTTRTVSPASVRWLASAIPLRAAPTTRAVT